MKNVFNLILKTSFFPCVEKRYDKKAKVNFKNYGVTAWETNNYNADIIQDPKKNSQLDNKISSFIGT